MSLPEPELLVLRNVRAIDPARTLDEQVDIVIERGVIQRLGRDAAQSLKVSPNEKRLVIEGHGRWVLPGLVDMHTHLREPGQESKEDIASGLRAAAAGGFVRVCAMPNTRPVNDTRAITEMMRLRAKEIGGVQLYPIAAITMGQQGTQLTEMAALREAGAMGVSDDGRCVMSSSVMRHALQYAKTFDLVVIQHAEDHTLTEGAQMHEGVVSSRLGLRGWPRVAEDIIVARDLLLAQETGARYHVAHVSSHGAVRLLREAKARGLAVTAEVTPHHLLLTDADVLGYNTACKVNPPLREACDGEALWEGLCDGTIDTIATDHAPHSSLEKDCPFTEAAPGMVGLELCLPLLVERALQGSIPLGRLIDALTHAPCQALGVQAPTLREGAHAEICLFDPDARWPVGRSRLYTKSLNTPFLGRELSGEVQLTVIGQRIIHQRDTLNSSVNRSLTLSEGKNG